MANTLAYYDMTTMTAVKSFIVQAPGKILKIVSIKIKIGNKIEERFVISAKCVRTFRQGSLPEGEGSVRFFFVFSLLPLSYSG